MFCGLLFRAQEKAAKKAATPPSSKTPSKNNESSPKVKVAASPPKVTNPDLDIFNDSTDEDEPNDVTIAMETEENGSDSGFPDLPDFFSGKNFFFYGDFGAHERRLLVRYIAAYDG